MFQVEVTGSFQAAHFLKLYDGTDEPNHGHLWKVAVLAESDKLDSMAVVVDFEALKPALKQVLAEFDRRSFNDVPDFKGVNPSTENIAKLIAEKLNKKMKWGNARLVRVTVWETPDASASYLP